MKNDSFSEEISIGIDGCGEIEKNLSAFVDGELSKDQIVKICDHLIECEKCKNSYKNLRYIQKSIKNYFNDSTDSLHLPDESLSGNIVERLIFEQRRRKIIYATAVLAVFAGVAYYSHNFINVAPTEKEAVHTIKFIDKKPVLTPLPNAQDAVIKDFKDFKDFTDKLKDKK